MLRVLIRIAFIAVGIVAIAEPVPGIEHVLHLDPRDNTPRNWEGDFITLVDGRLLFVYARAKGNPMESGEEDLVGRYSSDGGKTWTDEDRMIVANTGEMYIMSVSLLRLHDGRIALISEHQDSTADCRAYLRWSRDEAETWSDPVLCMDSIGYYTVGNDTLIQLPNGRLLLPASIRSEGGAHFGTRGRATCYVSDDRGATWSRCQTVLEGPVDNYIGLSAPAVVRLKSGRLLMLSGTGMDMLMRSYSDDDGDTWSKAVPTDILSTTASPAIERVPGTDVLVMVWTPHLRVDSKSNDKHAPLTLAVSHDEGHAWTTLGSIEEELDHYYNYAAITFVDDAMLVGYSVGDEIGFRSIHIVRAPLSTVVSLQSR